MVVLSYDSQLESLLQKNHLKPVPCPSLYCRLRLVPTKSDILVHFNLGTRTDIYFPPLPATPHFPTRPLAVSCLAALT